MSVKVRREELPSVNYTVYKCGKLYAHFPYYAGQNAQGIV